PRIVRSYAASTARLGVPCSPSGIARLTIYPSNSISVINNKIIAYGVRGVQCNRCMGGMQICMGRVQRVVEQGVATDSQADSCDGCNAPLKAVWGGRAPGEVVKWDPVGGVGGGCRSRTDVPTTLPTSFLLFPSKPLYPAKYNPIQPPFRTYYTISFFPF